VGGVTRFHPCCVHQVDMKVFIEYLWSTITSGVPYPETQIGCQLIEQAYTRYQNSTLGVIAYAFRIFDPIVVITKTQRKVYLLRFPILLHESSQRIHSLVGECGVLLSFCAQLHIMKIIVGIIDPEDSS